MNKIDRQILKNQRTIMEHLWEGNNETFEFLQDRTNETTNLLKDGEESKEEDCCKMPPRDEDFVISKDEVKKK